MGPAHKPTNKAVAQASTARSVPPHLAAAYRTADAYLAAVGSPLFTSSIGTEDHFRLLGGVRIAAFAPETIEILEADPRRVIRAKLRGPKAAPSALAEDKTAAVDR
mgnify:CR=1 FL=1